MYMYMYVYMYVFVLCFELRELGKLFIFFLLCVLFWLGNLIRGYTKTRYFCLLFWPCPLLKLSPLLLFFINKFVNKLAFCLMLSWEWP